MSKLARVAGLALFGAMVAGCASPAATPTPAPTLAPTDAPSPVLTPSPGPTPSPSPASSQAAAPSAIVSPAPSGATSPAPSQAAVPLMVEAREFSFTPRELVAPANEPFELQLHNAGLIVHNVTIDAAGVQIAVSPGRTGTTVVAGLAPGSYPFYCSISGHRAAGMSGTLTVR